MRLAIIADIHGNLPALRAVLADIERRHVDRIVNLGDCVSGPLWPRETMDSLEELELLTVRGNHDRWVAETPRSRMNASDAFAFDELSSSQRTALGALPAQCDVCEGVVAVHGTPVDDNQYLLEDILDARLVLAPPATIRGRLGCRAAGVVLCGHSHQPRIAQLAGEVLVVNPGSVGCPAYADPTPPAHVSQSGSPHARYALLSRGGGDWSVELIAIAYDCNAAAIRAAENGRSDWAQALKTGFIA